MTYDHLEPGKFSGPVRVEWLESDPRKMQLLEEVAYRDLKGKLWFAYRASIIDGASIPRFFWRVIGSPFIGKYRRPSVIHDVYCENQLRPAQDVHDVFKEMMLQDGVKEVKAETMYQAVNNFGPRW